MRVNRERTPKEKISTAVVQGDCAPVTSGGMYGDASRGCGMVTPTSTDILAIAPELRRTFVADK